MKRTLLLSSMFCGALALSAAAYAQVGAGVSTGAATSVKPAGATATGNMNTGVTAPGASANTSTGVSGSASPAGGTLTGTNGLGANNATPAGGTLTNSNGLNGGLNSATPASGVTNCVAGTSPECPNKNRATPTSDTKVNSGATTNTGINPNTNLSPSTSTGIDSNTNATSKTNANVTNPGPH